MSDDPQGGRRRRRVTPQDTLDLVKRALVPGDTSLTAVYAVGREEGLRSGCNEMDAHDLGTETMVQVADERATNSGYLTDPITFADDVLAVAVRIRKTWWQRNKRHAKEKAHVPDRPESQRSPAHDPPTSLDDLDRQ